MDELLCRRESVSSKQMTVRQELRHFTLPWTAGTILYLRDKPGQQSSHPLEQRGRRRSSNVNNERQSGLPASRAHRIESLEVESVEHRAWK